MAPVPSVLAVTTQTDFNGIEVCCSTIQVSEENSTLGNMIAAAVCESTAPLYVLVGSKNSDERIRERDETVETLKASSEMQSREQTGQISDS